MDTYGHLLDALDDEVMVAVEWAMNPDAPLPGFLAATGLEVTTVSLPVVHRQHSGMDQEGWKDASDPTEEPEPNASGPVFNVTAAGRKVPFAEQRHAQDFADQWNKWHACE